MKYKLIIIIIFLTPLSYSCSFADNFRGVDTPPTVLTISPAGNETNVSTTANVTITFDEPVSLSLDDQDPLNSNSIIIDCSLSGVQAYPDVSTNNVTIADIDLNDFVEGDECTVTVSLFWIHDMDDGNHFDGDGDGVFGPDYVSSFTVGAGVDTPPQVSMVTPADMNNNVAINSMVELVFNEPVDIPANAISLACTDTGTQTFPSVLTTPVTSISFDPNGFTFGESCSITASTLLIHDTDGFPDHLDGDGDGVANGDDFESFFTVTNGNGGNPPPRVIMVNPEDMSQNILPTSMVSLVFNEAVDIPVDAITINCTDTGIQSFPSVLTTPVTMISYNPTDFNSGESCSITASAFLIHDVDVGNPMHLDGNGDGISGEEDFESFFTVAPASELIFANGFD